jgi:outer membrane murein-binding lipoprotein Lpp
MGFRKATFTIIHATHNEEETMRKTTLLIAAAFMLSSIGLWGCSSSPTKDELKQLETTQAEITSLGQKAGALKMEKAALQQTINEKQAKLKTCQDDKAAVESKLTGVK